MVRTISVKNSMPGRLLGALLGAIFGAGCGGGEVAPDTIMASVVGAGHFALEGGRPARVDSETRIACAPGVLFGVDYRVEAEGVRFGGILPLEFRWRHPEMAVPSAKLWGSETQARLPNPKLAWGETAVEGRALWQLEHPEELQSGRYEFVIRVIGTPQVLLSQAFEVEGC